LTISSTAGGSVIEPGEGDFFYMGGSLAFVFAVADEGYQFVEWTGDVGTMGDDERHSTYLRMDNNYSITANFEEIPMYTLSVSSTTGGQVTSPGEGNFDYREGYVVTLIAAAEIGYRFVDWTGDVGDIRKPDRATTFITMNADYSITANFVETEEYTLTISSTAGGSVATPGEGTFTYSHGRKVDLRAQAEVGYKFVNWTGDVKTIDDVQNPSTRI